MSRIYLDNAATSWPKPEAVYQAVDQTQRAIGVSIGRGQHSESQQATRIVTKARRAIADLISAQDSHCIALMNSGTDALTTAIRGWVGQGDHVVTTAVDHNSVIRPLVHLKETGVIGLTVVDCDPRGVVAVENVRDAMTDQTTLVAVTHASNVLGTIQPVAEIGKLCETRGVALLVDGAQTIGHVDIDVNEIGCHLFAAPGHKGLLGPLGTGLLYVRPDIADRLTPLRFGGSGSEHIDQGQPTAMPSMLESGSLNVPAIAGLGAGVDFLLSPEGQDKSVNAVELTRMMREKLNAIDGIRVYGDGGDASLSADCLPMIALAFDGHDSATVAAILESAFGIQVRSGFHCAPLTHRSLGTEDGGLVRLSLGPFNTAAEIQVALSALSEIANA